MKKSNIFGTGDKRKVNPKWFTSKTWMKVLSDKIKSVNNCIPARLLGKPFHRSQLRKKG